MSSESIDAPEGMFLVVGCGSIGRRHLGNLIALGVREIAAFDVLPDRRAEASERFGVPTYADLEEALARRPRVALICTPTHLHLVHALAAAQAGCHLFIEKPVADSLEGLEPLMEEVERRRLVTLVGCNFRFHPGLRLVKDLLDTGLIGRPLSVRAQFGQFLPDWHPWEDYRHGYSARRAMGGGVVLDRVHEIDYVRWLTGEVVEVAAMVGRVSDLEIETEDAADILIRFASGAFGSIHVDYLRRPYDCSLEVVGELGTVQWRYQDHLVRWFTARDGTWQSRQWLGYDGNEMYVEEMRHFLRVLRQEEPSAQDVGEGARVLEIALAAKESANSGRRVLLSPRPSGGVTA